MEEIYGTTFLKRVFALPYGWRNSRGDYIMNLHRKVFRRVYYLPQIL